jgi:hypothetical protein
MTAPQCERPFRSDRATVHLFKGSGDGYKDNDAAVDEVGDAVDKDARGRPRKKHRGIHVGINDADFAVLKPHLRRGDLLEDVDASGYRSQGVYMYNGERVTHLDNSLDDYGCIGPEYVIYKDFNPHHWHTETMNVNNILVPDVDHASSGWHGGVYPCGYVWAPAVQSAVDLIVTFQDTEYEISRELKDWVDAQGPEGGREHYVQEAPYVSDIDDYIITGVVWDN